MKRTTGGWIIGATVINASGIFRGSLDGSEADAFLLQPHRGFRGGAALDVIGSFDLCRPERFIIT
jgi:hypothetical protein